MIVTADADDISRLLAPAGSSSEARLPPVRQGCRNAFRERVRKRISAAVSISSRRCVVAAGEVTAGTAAVNNLKYAVTRAAERLGRRRDGLT